MPIPKTEKIWHNGKFIKWEDANIHVLSHVVSYGSAVFEGIRCYDTKQGPAIFRLRDHIQRLLNSAYSIPWKFPSPSTNSAMQISISSARTTSTHATCGRL